MLSEYRKIVNALHDEFQEYLLNYSKRAKKLDEYNLTVQQENMLLFIMRNQRTTVNEIAANFSITKSAVSQVLSHLESKGFIRRESNPNDRRESFILLGPEGKKYAELIEETDEAFVKKYFSQVEMEELEQMLRTMKKINQVIHESNDAQ
ncbi:MarR family transcriptional regulator [Brevibacillus composti]|uniref:MarR family transcriptional regulator n=1 Tax=Brevibacillus composti TaxID=2796470 RepID=A0A7T5JQ15_9BACL|nr:MarR family transcriptional regulator [Brevibacillus composti]QQE75752.1 MarR family transcriptional regulator [Brevibacillus composti]QUO42778.1 MarR family transcriptional regulator [Brevibacillus composti]